MTGSLIATVSAKARSRASVSRCRRPSATPSPRPRAAPAVRAAGERAAQIFAELGAVVEEADPFSQSPMPIFQTLALGGFWALLRAQKPEAVALMDPGLVEMCRRGED